MKPEEYSAFIDSIWKANSKNIDDVAKQSLAAFPPPPIFASLEQMSGQQFSKLLADTQKRSFYLGALAATVALEKSAQAVKQ